MKPLTRREFLKYSGVSLGLLALPRPYLFANEPMLRDGLTSQAAPTPLGRIATWRLALREEPSPDANFVEWKYRNDIMPLKSAVEGKAPWPSNAIWYETGGGYIHSGYVQPVVDAPQSEVIAPVPEPGFWAEVCVPIAEARWRPNSSYVARRLYYQTVYRVIAAESDDEAIWWYRIQEGLTHSPGYYVRASSLRRIPPEALTPISPGHPDKRLQINIGDQTLTCFEGSRDVFHTRIASGVYGMGTPLGEFHVLYQRHTRRMVGGGDNDRYDLPGVPFPVYFTWRGVAIHGTYWHNDYGRRHSHGCINVTSEAARWIFRWIEPHVEYGTYTLRTPPGEGTRVVVI